MKKRAPVALSARGAAALSDVARWLVRRPVLTLCGLAAFALAIELAQSAPEVIPGAHAISEVVRNITYGLIGALLFSWLVVDIPARDRRRRSYEALSQPFTTLVTIGPVLADFYRVNAERLTPGVSFDPWDRTSFQNIVDVFAAVGVSEFPAQRAGVLEATVMAMEYALHDLTPSLSYLDDEVAHVLSQFPRQSGLSMMQVRKTASGGIEASLDLHITWTLLERARELYRALIDEDAYETDIFQPLVEYPEGPTTLPLSVIDEDVT